MSIFLYTGLPGTHKTSSMVERLLSRDYQNKLVFQHGINELRLPLSDGAFKHVEYLFCRDEMCTVCPNLVKSPSARYVDDWHLFVPVGGILVVDEAQMIFRPGGARDNSVPDSLKALETHRHGGTDIFFLTQHPSFVHIHIRRLTNYHYHCFHHWSGSRRFMTVGVTPEPSEYKGKSEKIKLDPSVYAAYKSAEVHTPKPKLRLPTKAYFFLFFFAVMIPLAGWLFYDLFTPDSPLPVSNASGPVGVASLLAPSSGSVLPDVPDAGSDVFLRDPVYREYPESAPAFRELVRVQAIPVIGGCMISARSGSCSCYLSSYPVTRVDVTQQFCRSYIDNPPFRPYEGSVSGSRSDSPFSSGVSFGGSSR